MPGMIGRHLLLLALGFATAWAQSSSATCYFPNGSVAADDIPCNSTSGTYSACCGSAGICMSSGLCLNAGSQPYALSRGSCTDENWGSSCAQRCHGSSDNPGGGITVVLFKVENGVSTYCCGNPVVSNGAMACPNSEQAFTLSDATIISGVAYLANYTETTASTSSTTAGSSSAAGHNSTTAVCPKSNEVAIGAGVGASLGAVAIAALCWALWERRRAGRQGPGSPATKSAGKFTPNTDYQPVQPYQPPQQQIYHYPGDQFGTPVNAATVNNSYPPTAELHNGSTIHSEMPANGGAVEIMDSSTPPTTYQDSKH